jgi:hypothetical protein
VRLLFQGRTTALFPAAPMNTIKSLPQGSEEK